MSNYVAKLLTLAISRTPRRHPSEEDFTNIDASSLRIVADRTPFFEVPKLSAKVTHMISRLWSNKANSRCFLDDEPVQLLDGLGRFLSLSIQQVPILRDSLFRTSLGSASDDFVRRR